MAADDDMLIYYDSTYATCPRKGRLALEEKGVPYRKIEVDYFSDLSAKNTEFWKANRSGVLPFIKHHGRFMRESTVICEYVDEAFDGPALMPSDPVWRALARLWMKRIEVELHVPHHLAINWAVVFAPDLLERDVDLEEYIATRPPVRRPIVRDTLERGLESDYVRAGLAVYDALFADMETALTETPYLGGGSFSLADIGAAPWALRVGREFGFAELLWEGRPHVVDWFERVSARDAFKRAIEVPGSAEWIARYRGYGEAAFPTVARILEELRGAATQA